MTLYKYSATLDRVVDGDTYDFTVDLSLNDALIKKFDVGVDQ